MLKNFLVLFTQQVEQQPSSAATVELATAALMYEVVHADSAVDHAEEEKVKSLLQQQFTIDPIALDALIRDGAENAKDAVDLVQFTRVLNQHYSLDQRAGILQKLWSVAYADQHLDKYEEHIIRRIADLMHIPHSVFIQAKLKAIESN
jgi:uncharacterized tellurite resistance protein B-like protein